MTLIHVLALALLLSSAGLITTWRHTDARSIRIDAVAVFHRAPSYRLRITSPSATGENYMDLNITERGKTEILPGELSCIPRPLSEFYENEPGGGTVDYCEIIFY